jgi:multidrug transporter EmrE-like cation transporter
MGNSTTHGPLLAILALLLVVLMNVTANVFLKLGANPQLSGFKLFGLFGWPVVVGIGCYAAGVLVYAWSLRHVDLHIAQAIVSLQFAGAVMASAFLFKEQISLHQWAGLSLIFLGLLIATR